MKLSICIPTFNFDSSSLIQGLLQQMDENTELIVIDDASKEEHKQKFREIQHSNYQFIELETNIGRSKIRNLFLNYAKSDYLLFLDGDCSLLHNDFLKRYLSEINQQPQIICGGRIYPEKCPSIEQALRWKYGRKLESKNAEERSQSPNSSFMTNNFLIQKEILSNLPFDERITQYGHEDTLFGIELEKKNIIIRHIENPILNGDIETNEVFLDKTEKSIKSLHQIIEFYPDTKQLKKHISLYRVACQLQKYQLHWIVLFFYFLTKAFVKKRILYARNPSLKSFTFYKLAYFFLSR